MVLPFTGLGLPKATGAAAPSRAPGLARKGAVPAVAPVVTPFTVKMPVPQVLQPAQTTTTADIYKMVIKPAATEIIPGVATQVLTYGGQFVGPTIRAKTGRAVKIVYGNSLDMPANVHLHGGHTPATSDGHPMDLIQPGQVRLYDYPNKQQGATLWYHDHSHHMEAEHVFRGLHGFYLIDDAAEKALRLPSGAYDVPIMLRDCAFDENNELLFFGDPAERTTILANGKIKPYFQVARRKYRFRLLNASNEHVFKLNLGGETMMKIASDGGLLPAPVPVTEMVLASAERVEIVVDFARYPIGTRLELSNGSDPVLRFDVTKNAYDDSLLPATLRPLPAMPAATVNREVRMNFDLSGEAPVGLVNGLPYDPSRVDFQVKRGTTEIWNVINTDTFDIDHTFHLHLEQFRVIGRNGGPPLPQDQGRKDTVHLPPHESVQIQVTFGDYLGKYVYHCHYLEHSSIGMMAQVEIVP